MSPTRTPSTVSPWWIAGLAAAAVAWGTNQFPPMLLVYRTELGLSDTAVQASFGAYALGLIPALLVLGRVSDLRGRRTVVVAGVVLSIVATLLIVAGSAVEPLLYLGRFVAGVASAAAFGPGAAWIRELSAREGAAERAPQRTTVAMTTGFALSPLASGILAQFAPAPLVIPYLPHLVLSVVALVLLRGATETVERRDRTDAAARPSPVRPGAWAILLLGVAPPAPWVFGNAAIAQAFLPALLQPGLGPWVLLFTAVMSCVGAFAGIAVQPAITRMSGGHRHRTVIIASLMTVVGMVLGVVTAATLSPVLCAIAGLCLGAAYGACQVAGLGIVSASADPSALGTMVAVYQAVAYLGFGLPLALAGLATAGVSALGGMLGVALLATVMLGVASIATTAFRAPRAVPHPEPVGHDSGS